MNINIFKTPKCDTLFDFYVKIYNVAHIIRFLSCNLNIEHT